MGNPYLSAKVYDASFSAAIYASLIEGTENAGNYALIWSLRTVE